MRRATCECDSDVSFLLLWSRCQITNVLITKSTFIQEQWNTKYPSNNIKLLTTTNNIGVSTYKFASVMCFNNDYIKNNVSFHHVFNHFFRVCRERYESDKCWNWTRGRHNTPEFWYSWEKAQWKFHGVLGPHGTFIVVLAG